MYLTLLKLSDEFDLLKVQLKEKDKQISMLQQALDQQQKLIAGILSEKTQLQLELTEEKNKSWWLKIFEKRK